MRKNQFYLFLLPFLLIGCSSNNEPHGEGEKEEDCIIKENTEIEFLSMLDSKYFPVLQNIIDEFEKTEPHVKVTLSNPLGSGNYTMLEKLVVSGFFKEDYPDLVQCYPDNVYKYIAQGYGVNVDPYINNEIYGLKEEKSDYVTAFMEEGRHYQEEGTYSLPFCKSTELLYYNYDVLVGLDLSSVDSTINNGKPLDETYLSDLTWEELFNKLAPAIKTYDDNIPNIEDKILKIVKNEKGDVLPGNCVFTYDSSDNLFITLAKQYGYGYTSVDENNKGHIDFNNPEMRNLLIKLREARINGYLHTKASNNNNYVSYLFQNQQTLFTISSNAGLSYNFNFKNPFRIGVAKIPHPEGKEYSSINQGPSLCILRHDENRSLASYLLWKFITTENNATEWSLKTNYMPIRNSCFTNQAYINAITADENSSLYEIAESDNLKMLAAVSESTFSTPVFRESGNARSNALKLVRDCLTSTISIDELFDYYSSLENKVDYPIEDENIIRD